MDVSCLWTICYLLLYLIIWLLEKRNVLVLYIQTIRACHVILVVKTLELKQDDILASWGRLDHNMKGQKRHIHTDKNPPTTSRRKLQGQTLQHHQASEYLQLQHAQWVCHEQTSHDKQLSDEHMSFSMDEQLLYLHALTILSTYLPVCLSVCPSICPTDRPTNYLPN
jgi:hypothetical protein